MKITYQSAFYDEQVGDQYPLDMSLKLITFIVFVIIST